MKNKIILIDGAPLAFKAIFNYELALMRQREQGFVLPANYTYFASIISCLKKIGVDENTQVIVALEDRSWRKNYLSSYKSNREENRKKHKLINWTQEFQNINLINQQLDEATPFHFLRVTNCEADDIISASCRFFKDSDITIVSIDSDLKMLCYYPNVKYFSLMVKCKGSNGSYVKVDNPLKILDEKIRKGDKSDNILVSKDDDENDVELRRQIVNLLQLPDFIENPIIEKLKNLSPKEPNYDKLPFKSSLGQRFFDIFKKDNVVTPEYCFSLQEKRIKRKKKQK